MIALLIDLGWKSAVIAGLALLASHALRNRAAVERVMLLRVAAAALLMLPIFALGLPALEIGILPALEAAPAAALAMPPAVHVVAGQAQAPVHWPMIVTAFYGTGVVLLLLRLIAGLATLRHWTRRAVPASNPRWLAAAARASAALRCPVHLLVSPQVAAPLSWGVAPAWVLIGPATQDRAEQADAVIAHEMAHIRRLDWPVLILSRLATAIFWFNPLVWLVDRALARQAELAADEDAVRHVALVDYARTLLTVATLTAHPAACGMAAPKSMLARRIGRVLEDAPRPPVSRLLCSALLICGPGMAVPLAAMKLVRAPSADATAPTMRVRHDPLPTISATRIVDRREVVKPRAEPLSAVVPVPVPASAHAPMPAPESEPSPPAAVASQAAVETPDATVERQIAVGKGRAIATQGRRELARGLSDSANDMRADARALERGASKEALSPADREERLRSARSLRVQAEQLDVEARRLVFGPEG